MIKKTEISKLTTPKVMDAKQSYSNKGTVSLKKAQKVSVNTKATPGIGSGQSRGVGIAETGKKFSGVY